MFASTKLRALLVGGLALPGKTLSIGLKTLLLVLLLGGDVHGQPPEERAVTIHIKLTDNAFGAPGEVFDLYSFEDQLQDAVDGEGVVDGHGVGLGFMDIFLYTADPDQLIAHATTLLSSPSIPAGSYVDIDAAAGGNPKRIDLPLEK